MQPGASRPPGAASLSPLAPCDGWEEGPGHTGRVAAHQSGAASLSEDMSPLPHRLHGQSQTSFYAHEAQRVTQVTPHHGGDPPGEGAGVHTRPPIRSRRCRCRRYHHPRPPPAATEVKPPPPPPQRLVHLRLVIGCAFQSQLRSLLFRLADSPACLHGNPALLFLSRLSPPPRPVPCPPPRPPRHWNPLSWLCPLPPFGFPWCSRGWRPQAGQTASRSGARRRWRC